MVARSGWAKGHISLLQGFKLLFAGCRKGVETTSRPGFQVRLAEDEDWPQKRPHPGLTGVFLTVGGRSNSNWQLHLG